jgi:predicted TIM-barrel fold metal-dependent hydrolase
MTADQIPAIDVHAHYGRYVRRETTDLENQFMTGGPEVVVARARQARTTLTIVSPLLGLFPRGGADAVAGNEEAAGVVPRFPELRWWVVVHPLQPATYDQARRLLATPQCVGIKIHPEEHQYPIAEHGTALFSFAAEQGAVIMAHSGDPLSAPAAYVPFADAFPAAKVILAHLGNGGAAGGRPDLQVQAIQASRHGNLHTDTSSARSLMPGLIEWAAAQVGAGKILYGTDTPLYFAPSQRARIDGAELSEADKQLVLRGNALRLLGEKVASA